MSSRVVGAWRGIGHSKISKGIMKLIATATPEWIEDKLVVHAAFPLGLTAYKVERPALLFIPTEDTLEFILTTVFH